MKLLKALLILLLSLLLSIPRFVIWILKVLEGIVRIIRTTITFFIKQIEIEVLNLKPDNHGKANEKRKD